MCHFAEVWHTLRRKAWSWSLQHQAGSHGGFISTSCSQTIGQFIRKRTAAAPAGEATDDEVGDAMRAAVKKARGVAAPKTPPKAKPVAGPKTLPKAMPIPKAMPKTPAQGGNQSGTGQASGQSYAKERGKQAGDRLDLHLERLGVGSGTAQAPTCIWTSRKGGELFLAGLPMRQTVDKFPESAAGLLLSTWSREPGG